MEMDLILSAGRSETMSEVKYLPWFILCFTTRLLVEHIGDDGSKILLSFFLAAIFVVMGSIRPHGPPNVFEGLNRIGIA